MIYLDTSVLLAWIFGEDRHPPEHLWQRPLVSSRLLQYEVWTRINARGADVRSREAAEDALGRVSLVELTPVVLSRALAPWPTPTRTLDALHVATALFLRDNRQGIEVASYDTRLCAAASAAGLALAMDIG
ncbi:MAG: PIN domain-containing protein [Myxococcota bacterium]